MKCYNSFIIPLINYQKGLRISQTLLDHSIDIDSGSIIRDISFPFAAFLPSSGTFTPNSHLHLLF